MQPDSSRNTCVHESVRERQTNAGYAPANLPGQVEEYEDTHCPKCNRAVIRRTGYVITAYHITANGACAYCDTPIPGKWHDDPQKARLHGRGVPLPVWS